MTAMPLFDLLAGAGNSTLPMAQTNLASMGDKLVEHSLADWKELLEYEDQFSVANWDDRERGLGITRLIYSMFGQWTQEAQQILARVRQLQAAGHNVVRLPELEDAIGKASARLKLTPDQI